MIDCFKDAFIKYKNTFFSVIILSMITEALGNIDFPAVNTNNAFYLLLLCLIIGGIHLLLYLALLSCFLYKVSIFKALHIVIENIGNLVAIIGGWLIRLIVFLIVSLLLFLIFWKGNNANQINALKIIIFTVGIIFKTRYFMVPVIVLDKKIGADIFKLNRNLNTSNKVLIMGVLYLILNINHLFQYSLQVAILIHAIRVLGIPFIYSMWVSVYQQETQKFKHQRKIKGSASH